MKTYFMRRSNFDAHDKLQCRQEYDRPEAANAETLTKQKETSLKRIKSIWSESHVVILY